MNYLKALSWIKRLEPIIFSIISFYFASYIFNFEYFVTSDGPSHVYNANIMKELIIGSDGIIDQYFQLNFRPVPNWLGHGILALLSSFVSSQMAEKIFLSIYFISFLFGLRYLIKSFKPSNGFFALLGLPFILNMFLYSGFYNFCIAFVFLFVIIGYFVRNSRNLTIRKCIVLALLFLLLFFTHLLVLAITFLIIALLVFWDFIVNSDEVKVKVKLLIKQGVKLLIIASPAILLSLLYMMSHGTPKVIIYYGLDELLEMITHVRPLMGHGPAEDEYNQFYILLLGFIILFSLYENRKSLQIKREDGFLITSILFAVLFFILPDSDGRVAFVSARILAFVLLFLLIRITLLKLSPIIMLIFIFLVGLNTKAVYELRNESQGQLSDITREIQRAGDEVKMNSTVLPISTSNHWMTQNLFNYLAPKKSVVFLMNYEANQPFFPVIWEDKIPLKQAFTIQPNPICETHLTLLPLFEKLPEYLFFYGGFQNNVPCWPSKFGNDNYQIRYESTYCSLYELNH